MTFLGMLAAFGPFVTDMYLPTLPSMAEIFDTTPSLVQMGLTTSMFGLALGQIFFGPLSDKFGRKAVLIAAMLLFTVSTVASIYSPSIEFFILCRFLQGLGGSGGIVLSRSIATDCYQGRELAKSLAIIGAVNGVAPVSAPIAGGLVAEAVGWQGIFWILFGIGMTILLMCIIFRESLRPEKRHRGSVISLMGNFPKLLHMRMFVIYVLMFAFGCGVLFSYIASASFILQDHFGFSELGFSLIFGINAIGIAVGSTISLKFSSMTRAAIVGTTIVAIAAILQIPCYRLFGFFPIYEGLTLAMLIGVGFILTSSTTLAMDEGRQYAGSASAIFGATGFFFGGIVSPLVGMGDIMMTTLVLCAICAVFSLTFAFTGNRLNKIRSDESI